MKSVGIGALAAVVAVAMASGTSVAQCVVTSVPAGDYSYNDGTLYIEERQNCVNFQPDGGRGAGCGYDEVPPTAPPPYDWGFVFGGGTWHYQEQNTLSGMQAGGFGVIPETPGCGTVPCIIFDDPVTDETCGSGPDRLIL